MHSNGQGFRCRMCDKAYARQDSLAYHLRLDCPSLKPGASGTEGGAGGRGRAHGEGGRGAPREEAAGTSVGIAFAHDLGRMPTASTDGAGQWWSQMTAVVTPFLTLNTSSNASPSVHKVLAPRFELNPEP